jgi:hypothetical protein
MVGPLTSACTDLSNAPRFSAGQLIGGEPTAGSGAVQIDLTGARRVGGMARGWKPASFRPASRFSSPHGIIRRSPRQIPGRKAGPMRPALTSARSRASFSSPTPQPRPDRARAKIVSALLSLDRADLLARAQRPREPRSPIASHRSHPARRKGEA